MTINLSPAVKADLVLKITEGLQATVLKNDFLTWSDLSWAEEAYAALPDDVRTKMERFIGEDALAKFITTEINYEAHRAGLSRAYIKGGPLTSLSLVANTVGYARKLITRLEGLPYRYRLTVALPHQFSKSIVDEIQDCIELPAGVTIAKGNALPTPLPVHSPVASIDNHLFWDWSTKDVQREFLDDRLYFSVPMTGYAQLSPSSIMGRSLEDMLRAFCGASMAVKLMRHNYDWEEVKLNFITIHDEQKRELLNTEELEKDFLDRSDFCSTEDFAKEHATDLWAVYQTTLTKIGTIFNDDRDCRRLFAACVWYYRAQVNRRPLDALLQATISIEVMLGDRKASDGIGLTNLLSSRCSYLLGRSTSHRERIADAFKNVYELRSQIVHEGHHVLRPGDRKTLNLALALCSAIISKELEVRAADTPKA